jgi:RHS repeat-associated protein
MRAWVLHLNGSTLSQERVFDDWGRLVRYPLGGSVRDLTYDAADRIVSFTHYNAVSGAPVTALNQTFVYDEVGRITAVGTSVGSWAFGYDDTGNRTSSIFTAGGGTQSRAYSIAPTSNRLLGMSNPARTFSHDAAGNTESDVQAGVGYTATHDLSGRIVRIDSALSGGYRYQTEYTHNTVGLRVLKRPISAQRCVTSPGGATACSLLGVASATIYVYDPSGQLLGEYDELGSVLREYVWLQDTLVAILDGQAASTQVSFVQSDHLGTPRVVIDSAGQQRWSWLAEPFGDSAPVENPIGAGVFRLNLRMPGQYWDRESGLSYNWHRSYDAGMGRYTQSDPIGLAGGINTYAYVNSAPTMFTDPDGLQPAIPMPAPVGLPMLPPWLIPVAGAGLAGWEAGNLINPYVQPYVSRAIDWCMSAASDTPTQQECDAEWLRGRNVCFEWMNELNRPGISDRRRRELLGLTGGNMAICVNGQVSQACGGTKREQPPKPRRKRYL